MLNLGGTPTSADITLSRIRFAAPEGQVYLSNQYNPNLTLPGGDIVFTGIAPTINVSSAIGNGGDVVIDSRGAINLFRDVNVSSTGGAGFGSGDVTLLAQGDITTIGIVGTSINGDSGSIRIETTGSLNVTNPLGLDVHSTNNRGGSISVTADSGITIAGDVNTFAAGAAGEAGNVTLDSANGAIVITGATDASSATAGGNVTLVANQNISTGSITAVSDNQAGNIRLESTGGAVTTADIAASSLNLGGDITLIANNDVTLNSLTTIGDSQGGAITLNSSTGSILATGNITLGSLNPTLPSGGLMADALGTIDLSAGITTGFGASGPTSILIGSMAAPVTALLPATLNTSGADFSLSTAADLTFGTIVDTNGGNYSLVSTGNLVVTNFGLGATNGGDIILTGATIDTSGTTLGASSSIAPGGNITLTATGNITTADLLAESAVGSGGNIVVNAGGALNITTADYRAGASSVAGDGGTITLTANGDITSTLTGFSFNTSALAGAGGAISITSATGSIDLLGSFIASGDGLGGRSGGEITFSAPISITVEAVDSTGAVGTGNQIFTSNQISFPVTPDSIAGFGSITLQPATPGQNILVGGPSNATTLGLDFSGFQAGFSSILIGRPDGTGTITLTTIVPADPVTIQGAGTLVGANQDNTWQLTGLNSGIVDGLATGPITFNNVGNLTGGTLDDSFQFSSGIVFNGQIDGNTGFDRLDYSAFTSDVTIDLATLQATNIEEILGTTAATTSLIGPDPSNLFTLTGVNTGTINGITFIDVQVLQGGTGDDTVQFNGGSIDRILGDAGTLSLVGDLITVGSAVAGTGDLVIQPATTGLTTQLGGAGPIGDVLFLPSTLFDTLQDGFSTIRLGGPIAPVRLAGDITVRDPLLVQTNLFSNLGGSITGQGNASVDISATGTLAIGDISTAGQPITLNSGSTLFTGNLFTQPASGGAAAPITLTAVFDIITGDLGASSVVQTGDGNAGDGGAVTITSQAGSITTGFLESASEVRAGNGNTGTGGPITLEAAGDVQVQSIASYSVVRGNGTAGDAGAVTLTSTSGSITISSFTEALSRVFGIGNTGSGAPVNLTAAGPIVTGDITTQADIQSGTTGSAGEIRLTSGDTLTTGSVNSFAIVRGDGIAGNGGGIILESAGNLTSGLISSTTQVDGNGTAGNAGLIQMTSGGQITLQQGLGASSRVLGTGTAGNAASVTLNAVGNITTDNLRSRASTGNGIAGNGGPIRLETTNGAVVTAAIDTSSLAQTGSSGSGGDLTLISPVSITTGTINTNSSSLNGGNVFIDPLGDTER